MKNKIMQSGFSLVELSVVLTVIGITLSGALVIATKKTESDKIEETNYKLDKIENAIDAYLVKNGRLPCAANGSYVETNAAFAFEGFPNESSGSGACSVASFSAGNIYSGIVPTKTLQLADEFMLDGWGRRISYVVDARFANNITTNGICNGGSLSGQKICFKYQPAGGITVKDASGQNRTTQAVYVLFSSGKNGNGAWKRIGSATMLAASLDAGELENAGDDEGAFDTVFIQKDETTTFDDILRYRTKPQIMSDAKTVTDFDLCNQAADAATLCAGSASATNCTAMATQITAWCLDM